MQQGLLYDVENDSYYIRELEVSINNSCNLQCQECGFKIPRQLLPYKSDPITETVKGLEILKKLKINIKNMVVVGGEPLLSHERFENAVKAFKQTKIMKTLEVVSNGLFPQGLSKTALEYINCFTLSRYFKSKVLVDLWKKFISQQSSRTKFILREKTDKWNKWWGNNEVDQSRAQKMYDTCFYRRHCVTIERERLFSCSRIAKEGNDIEGLELSDIITFKQVEAYLNSPQYIPSCLKCTPMMGFPKVEGGIQPDNRIEKLSKNAITFLKQQIQSL